MKPSMRTPTTAEVTLVVLTYLLLRILSSSLIGLLPVALPSLFVNVVVGAFTSLLLPHLSSEGSSQCIAEFASLLTLLVLGKIMPVPLCWLFNGACILSLAQIPQRKANRFSPKDKGLVVGADGGPSIPPAGTQNAVELPAEAIKLPTKQVDEQVTSKYPVPGQGQVDEVERGRREWERVRYLGLQPSGPIDWEALRKKDRDAPPTSGNAPKAQADAAPEPSGSLAADVESEQAAGEEQRAPGTGAEEVATGESPTQNEVEQTEQPAQDQNAGEAGNTKQGDDDASTEKADDTTAVDTRETDTGSHPVTQPQDTTSSSGAQSSQATNAESTCGTENQGRTGLPAPRRTQRQQSNSRQTIDTRKPKPVPSSQKEEQQAIAWTNADEMIPEPTPPAWTWIPAQAPPQAPPQAPAQAPARHHSQDAAAQQDQVVPSFPPPPNAPGMHQQMPHPIPQQIPQQISQQIPQHVPQQMPQQMPRRMPRPAPTQPVDDDPMEGIVESGMAATQAIPAATQKVPNGPATGEDATGTARDTAQQDGSPSNMPDGGQVPGYGASHAPQEAPQAPQNADHGKRLPETPSGNPQNQQSQQSQQSQYAPTLPESGSNGPRDQSEIPSVGATPQPVRSAPAPTPKSGLPEPGSNGLQDQSNAPPGKATPQPVPSAAVPTPQPGLPDPRPSGLKNQPNILSRGASPKPIPPALAPTSQPGLPDPAPKGLQDQSKVPSDNATPQRIPPAPVPSPQAGLPNPAPTDLPSTPNWTPAATPKTEQGTETPTKSVPRTLDGDYLLGYKIRQKGPPPPTDEQRRRIQDDERRKAALKAKREDEDKKRRQTAEKAFEEMKKKKAAAAAPQDVDMDGNARRGPVTPNTTTAPSTSAAPNTAPAPRSHVAQNNSAASNGISNDNPASTDTATPKTSTTPDTTAAAKKTAASDQAVASKEPAAPKDPSASSTSAASGTQPPSATHDAAAASKSKPTASPSATSKPASQDVDMGQDYQSATARQQTPTDTQPAASRQNSTSSQSAMPRPKSWSNTLNSRRGRRSQNPRGIPTSAAATIPQQRLPDQMHFGDLAQHNGTGPVGVGTGLTPSQMASGFTQGSQTIGSGSNSQAPLGSAPLPAFDQGADGTHSTPTQTDGSLPPSQSRTEDDTMIDAPNAPVRSARPGARSTRRNADAGYQALTAKRQAAFKKLAVPRPIPMNIDESATSDGAEASAAQTQEHPGSGKGGIAGGSATTSGPSTQNKDPSWTTSQASADGTIDPSLLSQRPQAPQRPQETQRPQAPHASQAPQVPQGPQGPQAPQAPQGLQRPQGPQGLQGPQRPQGSQAPQGPQAPQTQSCFPPPQPPHTTGTPQQPLLPGAPPSNLDPALRGSGPTPQGRKIAKAVPRRRGNFPSIPRPSTPPRPSMPQPSAPRPSTPEDEDIDAFLDEAQRLMGAENNVSRPLPAHDPITGLPRFPGPGSASSSPFNPAGAANASYPTGRSNARDMPWGTTGGVYREGRSGYPASGQGNVRNGSMPPIPDTPLNPGDAEDLDALDATQDDESEEE
ncbi:proteinral transcriptional corepressor ssn6 [Sphaceloma murrayae]|uniref:Proteinral transcriptional corepressor ssn6 n=1 Tax=Sphaceloma murrayae TaxID=2082308 RepID=A0A2K1QM48_9PEZI|nr:proteinral transcriptional corepressor ssn6 [Sphaceloma murrayae]